MEWGRRKSGNGGNGRNSGNGNLDKLGDLGGLSPPSLGPGIVSVIFCHKYEIITKSIINRQVKMSSYIMVKQPLTVDDSLNTIVH